MDQRHGAFFFIGIYKLIKNCIPLCIQGAKYFNGYFLAFKTFCRFFLIKMNRKSYTSKYMADVFYTRSLTDFSFLSSQTIFSIDPYVF